MNKKYLDFYFGSIITVGVLCLFLNWVTLPITTKQPALIEALDPIFNTVPSTLTLTGLQAHITFLFIRLPTSVLTLLVIGATALFWAKYKKKMDVPLWAPIALNGISLVWLFVGLVTVLQGPTTAIHIGLPLLILAALASVLTGAFAFDFSPFTSGKKKRKK